MKLRAVAVLALLAGCAPQQVEGPARFTAATGPVGDFALPLQSFEERRYAGVIRQRYDFSCGSAALATLLRHHYDFDVGEETAFRGMWRNGDQAQIRQVGFSLLDMKRWLASRGLSGDGYQVSLDEIARTGVPGIALIAVRNYRHFVVVKGVRGDEVLLGDPSLGLSIMPREAFVAAWNGVYFALSDDQPMAKTRFNRDGQWAAYARADLGGRFAEPVSHQALMLTAPFYRDLS
ncbi:MAG TPA: C39 family peptidase [Croceibacterium sp.]|nr:C39 family peptidase [Croceibacterium sp.]